MLGPATLVPRDGFLELVAPPPGAGARREAPTPLADFSALVSFSKTLLGRLSLVERHALRAVLAGGLSVGTMCSGSDSPILGLEALEQAVAESFADPRLTGCMKHAFSVEANPRKREFIAALFPNVPHIFVDTMQMGAPTAVDVRAPRVGQGPGRSPVPGADICIAGFPCQDVSRLNESRSSSINRQTIRSGTLRTGTCFWGIVQWARTCNCKLLILENVRGLADRRPGSTGPSNLHACLKALSEAGFVSRAYLLSPALFGWPQSRPRFWILCISRAALATKPAFDVAASLDALMVRFGGHLGRPMAG